MNQDAGYRCAPIDLSCEWKALINSPLRALLSFRTRLHVQIPEHHEYEEPAPDPAPTPSNVPKTLQLRRLMPSANQARRGRLSEARRWEHFGLFFLEPNWSTDLSSASRSSTARWNALAAPARSLLQATAVSLFSSKLLFLFVIT